MSSKDDVLIVEDSPAIGMLLKNYLEKLGYAHIHICINGSTAIETFKELVTLRKHPIVLLDYMLPDMDARSILTQMLEVQPNARVVLETATEKDDEGIKELIRLGIYQYLEKPIRFESLKSVFETIETEQSFFEKESEQIKILKESAKEDQIKLYDHIDFILKSAKQISLNFIEQLIGSSDEAIALHLSELEKQGKVTTLGDKKEIACNQCDSVKTTIYPILDNNNKVIEYISIRVDITEQIKKQEQLNKALHLIAKSKFLTNIYENSMALFRTVDTDGCIIECNQSYADSLGYSKEEIVGQTIYEHTSEESIPILKKTFQEWKNKGVVFNSEIFLRRKDGTTFPVSLNANNLYDKKGNLIGSNTILQDITEMYNLRKQKDNFLAMITHELKTPLVPIIGYTDLLLEQKFGELTEKQYSSLNSIRTNSKSLLRLISDLLDLQKLELGTFKFSKNNFILSDLIQECLQQISTEFNDKNIKVMQNIENNLYCYCDSDRIKQTILNLITNAIDFCPKINGQITVSLRHEKNTAKIVIRDNGRGMTESELSMLFTKFYQADPSITRVHGGTGLGLSICNAIVSEHGGQISVKSEGLQKGTEIQIVLPLVDALKTNELCEERTCHVCNKEMILDDGDVTFDAKWFHCKCWNDYEMKCKS